MFRKICPKLTTIGAYSINLDGENVNYILKQSSKAKYIRLEIHPKNGLIVVIPKQCPKYYVNDFINNKQGWIIKKLAKFRDFQAQKNIKRLKDNDIILYFGKEIKINVKKDTLKRLTVNLKQDALEINLNNSNHDLPSIIEWWYREQAKTILTRKIEEISQQMNVKFNKFIIRGQKTRWGSCSRKATLSFNWKMLMAPEPVINYIIIHELAHIRHLNHSSKFWSFVANYCPDYKIYRKWIREHNELLYY